MSKKERQQPSHSGQILSPKKMSLLLYKFRASIAQLIMGIKYRLKIYPLLLRTVPGKIFALLATILGVLGISARNWNEVKQFVEPVWNEITNVWNIPPTWFKVTACIILLTAILIQLYRVLTSKERLFNLATRRLNNKVASEERAKAVRENPEAELLIKYIDHGKRNDKAYDFLTNLWLSYIKENPALSMLSIPGHSDCRPIVKVNITHLPINPEHPEEQLNSIIRIKPESIYKDYRDFPGHEYEYNEENEYRESDGQHEAFYVCKPVSRYLTRYNGPDKEQVGFRNDYIGYNACLRSMNFENGRLRLPIECTMELYGNIMDSSDCLINELYLHFASTHGLVTPDPEVDLDFLTWRKMLHKRYQHPTELLTQVRGRAAAFGISALTVFNMEGSYVAARGLRTRKVGTFPDVYHVIPSGMTNIKKNDPVDKRFLYPNNLLNLQLLFEKEFMEEVFSEAWARDLNVAVNTWPERVKNKAKEHLYGLNNEYDTKMYLTGIVFDLMNYRPEICALILINSPQWWADHDPNKDSSKTPWKLSTEWSQEAPRIHITDDYDVINAMPPNHSVPAGIAAFHLGVEKARSLIR